MDESLAWKILFYKEENGTCPVREFLAHLSDDDQMRIRASLKKLQALNISAREPLVDHLEGKLCELRVESCRKAYRLVYYMSSARQIVLLHGFHKKTKKTPRHEIIIAERRYQNHLKRS